MLNILSLESFFFGRLEKISGAETADQVQTAEALGSSPFLHHQLLSMIFVNLVTSLIRCQLFLATILTH
jgi:hypothetical protein